MKPFFSIIIPTLNEEKFVFRLLNNIAKQKENDFEVIVVDGSSSDSTQKVVKQYSFVNLKEVNKHNVSYQRNYGAKNAKGQYLVFLDADSEISLVFLSQLKKIISKNKGLIFIPYIAPEKKYKLYQPMFDLSNNLVELSANFNKKFSLGGSMIVERNFFDIIGGFDDRLFLSEDHELIQRASSWGVRAKFLKKPKIFFSMRRWQKEGDVKILGKHILATAYRLFGGEIDKKIFEYKMGGQMYKEKKLNTKLAQNYQKIVKNVKKIIRLIS